MNFKTGERNRRFEKNHQLYVSKTIFLLKQFILGKRDSFGYARNALTYKNLKFGLFEEKSFVS